MLSIFDHCRFRRGFQQVFRWCPFVHYTEVEGGTTAYMMHTQRERETTRYSVTGSPELQLSYNSTRVSRNGLSVKSNFQKPPCPNVFHRSHQKKIPNSSSHINIVTQGILSAVLFITS